MSVSSGIREVVYVCVRARTRTLRGHKIQVWCIQPGIAGWGGKHKGTKRHNVRPCKCWCPYAFTTGRHSANVIHVTNWVTRCCQYCQIVSACFISLYSFSTSFCQERLITDMCDNTRKLATCGGKTVKHNVIQCQRILMMVYYNCDKHFGHCPSYMAKNPTGWICLHPQMTWGGGKPTTTYNTEMVSIPTHQTKSRKCIQT